MTRVALPHPPAHQPPGRRQGQRLWHRARAGAHAGDGAHVCGHTHIHVPGTHRRRGEGRARRQEWHDRGEIESASSPSPAAMGDAEPAHSARPVRISHALSNTCVATWPRTQRYGLASDVWSFGLSIMSCALGRFPIQSEGVSAPCARPRRHRSRPLPAVSIAAIWPGRRSALAVHHTRARALPSAGGYWGLLHALHDEPAPRLPTDQFSPELCDFLEQVCEPARARVCARGTGR